MNLLEIAVNKNWTDIARLLLEHADKTVQFSSLLKSAVRKGFTAMVRVLLEHDNKTLAIEESLESAVNKKFTEIVSLLLEQGAKTRMLSELLTYAVNHKNTEMARLLLENGADPNEQSNLFECAVENSSVEFKSAGKVDSNIMCLLNDYGSSLRGIQLEHGRLLAYLASKQKIIPVSKETYDLLSKFGVPHAKQNEHFSSSYESSKSKGTNPFHDQKFFFKHLPTRIKECRNFKSNPKNIEIETEVKKSIFSFLQELQNDTFLQVYVKDISTFSSREYVGFLNFIDAEEDPIFLRRKLSLSSPEMKILVEMVKYHTASSLLSLLDLIGLTGLILKQVSLKATFVRDALVYCRDLH